MWRRIYIYIYMYMYMYMYMYVCMCVCVCARAFFFSGFHLSERQNFFTDSWYDFALILLR